MFRKLFMSLNKIGALPKIIFFLWLTVSQAFGAVDVLVTSKVQAKELSINFYTYTPKGGEFQAQVLLYEILDKDHANDYGDVKSIKAGEKLTYHSFNGTHHIYLLRVGGIEALRAIGEGRLAVEVRNHFRVIGRAVQKMQFDAQGDGFNVGPSILRIVERRKAPADPEQG